MENKVEYTISLRDQFKDKIRGAKEETDKFEKSVENASETVETLGKAAAVAFAVDKIRDWGSEIVETGKFVDTLNNRLKYSEGSTAAASEKFDYLVDRSNKLGLELSTTADSYSKLSAAAKGTILEGDGIRGTFEGVTVAASAMHLSAEQTEGVVKALTDMLGKGTVSAEELKGQLGDRLPGAVQIAARAMNTTTTELLDMMKDGKVLATEFLPLLGQQFMKEFGGTIPNATENSVMAINLMNTEAFLMKKELYEGLKPAIISTTLSIKDFYSLLRDGVGWMKEHSGVVKTAAVFIGTLAAGFIAYKGALMVATAAQWLWNIAMSANPIGIIITGIAALVTTIYWAWNTFEGFRGAIIGLWEAAKQVFYNIGDFFKKIFEPIFEAIDAFKEGRFADGAVAVGKMAFNLTPVGMAYNGATTLTKNVGLAFDAGYDRGVAMGDDRRTNGVTEGNGSTETVFRGGGTQTNNTLTTKAPGLKDSSSSVGGRATQITVNITNLVKEIHLTRGIKESAAEIEQIVVKTLTKGVNDFQGNIVTR